MATIVKDFKEFNIDIHFDNIKSMKKCEFKKIVDKKINIKAKD